MRFPPFIKSEEAGGKGSVIGFAAPSFGCAIEPYRSAFRNALKKFSERGFSTKLGPNVYAEEGIGIAIRPGSVRLSLWRCIWMTGWMLSFPVAEGS